MIKDIDVLENDSPCKESIEKYLQEWENTPDYVAEEKALDKLFFELCPYNIDMDDVMIKCLSLNVFYSTYIYNINTVVKHYLTIDIDGRLKKGDLELVDDLTNIPGYRYCYSFATKYCSHHRPDVYPIYDSYVEKVLEYYRDRSSFCEFIDKDLKNYEKYVQVIMEFRKFYNLTDFNVKQLDKYLWMIGKAAFDKYPKK